MSETELIGALPHIAWRAPVKTRILGSKDERYACRLCIGMKGLKAADIPDLPRTLESFAKHMALTHNLPADLNEQTTRPQGH